MSIKRPYEAIHGHSVVEGDEYQEDTQRASAASYGPGNRRLTKKERKALRKEKKRMMKKAAAPGVGIASLKEDGHTKYCYLDGKDCS